MVKILPKLVAMLLFAIAVYAIPLAIVDAYVLFFGIYDQVLSVAFIVLLFACSFILYGVNYKLHSGKVTKFHILNMAMLQSFAIALFHMLMILQRFILRDMQVILIPLNGCPLEIIGVSVMVGVVCFGLSYLFKRMEHQVEALKQPKIDQYT